MKNIRTTMVAVGIVAAMASCAKGETPAAPLPSTSMPAPTTTTEAGVSPKLFAAQAATAESKIQQLKEDLDGCGVPEDDMRGLTCQMILARAPIEGKVVAKELRALGTPPNDIAPIVDQVLSAADALGDVDSADCEKVNSNYADKWLMECSAAQLDSSSAVESLLGQLAGLKTV